jgi:hypothetical protein
MKIFIWLVLFIFPLIIYGDANVVYYKDCAGKIIFDPKTDLLNPTMGVAAWKNAVENIIIKRKGVDCLPDKWKKSMNIFLDQSITIKIIFCSEVTVCGQNQIKDGFKIFLPTKYNNFKCNCEEATILHELIHLGAGVGDSPEDHAKIRGCEAKCLKDIQNCKDFPPPGNECECQL